MQNITFRKVDASDKELIFQWLRYPHVQEFWDNTQAHKDDIENFMQGRMTPSDYCNGEFHYWLACHDGRPYAMLMTIQDTVKSPIDPIKSQHLSKTGHSYGLDYMIGDLKSVGIGLGAITLKRFIEYFREHVDLKADTFLIDPESRNTKARHVYMKAGFDYVGDFVMEGATSGAGKAHHLLVKKYLPEVQLVEATLDDHPMVQNMARFYVYDLSRECGHISSNWNLPANGLYENFDLKKYFVDEDRKAYLVKVYDEVAGFALLNQATTHETSTWNMGEFYIIAKFQGLGLGQVAAQLVWEENPGAWEVTVIPENQSALKFWQATISKALGKEVKPSLIDVDFDEHQPRRVLFRFNL